MGSDVGPSTARLNGSCRHGPRAGVPCRSWAGYSAAVLGPARLGPAHLARYTSRLQSSSPQRPKPPPPSPRYRQRRLPSLRPSSSGGRAACRPSPRDRQRRLPSAVPPPPASVAASHQRRPVGVPQAPARDHQSSPLPELARHRRSGPQALAGARPSSSPTEPLHTSIKLFVQSLLS
ncbi:hypothetical protein [Oryza sativa Japonica Group]|uniref:Uncharacterized protein n=1 Tax=Oryza sativa subsp. japonica TaxID=39947 RepID=Q5ZE80_ORYSJ|nr:hypothetical protein [Oryza sativa Japonica Group]